MDEAVFQLRWLYAQIAAMKSQAQSPIDIFQQHGENELTSGDL